jgi:hypothetical protein
MEILTKVVGYLRNFWTFLREYMGWKEALIVMLSVAVVVLGMIVLIVFFGPIILQSEYPYVYKNAVVSEIVPPKVKDKTQVLSQRKLFHIDHWGIAQNDDDCNPENPQRFVGACDETHIFESWTVMGEINLVSRGKISTGTYGAMEPLTPHVISPIDTGDPRKPQWRIQDRHSVGNRKKGALDVIITRRTILGGFQPVASDPLVPPGDPCQANAAGIYIDNPTGRAEVIISTPKESWPLTLTTLSTYGYRQTTLCHRLRLLETPGHERKHTS